MDCLNQNFAAIMTLISSLSATIISHCFTLKKDREKVKMNKVLFYVEKLYEDISNLTLLAKKAEHAYNHNNKDKQELVKFFDTVRLELISIKRMLVLSAIWLPDGFIQKINDVIIFINYDLERIYNDPDIAQKNDSIRREHAFSQYFNSFFKVLIEQETRVRMEIKDKLKIDISVT